MTQWDAENVGIFGYGSLLTEPGPDIGRHIIDRIPQRSPWPIEYARSSRGRGGGPTLVLHPSGGFVTGEILALDIKDDQLDSAREWLLVREGRPSQSRIKVMELGGLRNVLYADLIANIPDSQLTADHLADLAITSVASAQDVKRNGIRYLADNVERRIVTPLTDAYIDAVLRKTEARDLREAEKILIGARRLRASG
jgi:cation transport regulator ChaC